MTDAIYLNNNKIELGENTNIAFNIASYDVKKPGKRLVNYTSNIKIPATKNNNKIFGNTNLPSSLSTAPYDQFLSHLVKSGVVIIEDGRAVINSYSNNEYNISLFDKKQSSLAVLKDYNLNDIYNNYAVNDLVVDSPVTRYVMQGVDLDTVIRNQGATPRTDYWIPFMYNIDEPNQSTYVAQNESGDAVLSYRSNSIVTSLTNGFIYLPHLFSIIEAHTPYNFSGSLFSDPGFANTAMKMGQSFYVVEDGAGAYNFIIILSIDNFNQEFTLYDFILDLSKTFNTTIDISGTDITMNLFDDYETEVPLDLSGYLINFDKKYDPGYAQNNYITWKVDDGADEKVNALNIICNNKNVKAENVLAKLNSFTSVKIFPESLRQNVHYFKSSPSYHLIQPANMYTDDDITYKNAANTRSHIPISELWTEGFKRPEFTKIVNISDYYTILSKMLSNPAIYTCQMLLNIKKIEQLKIKKIVKLKELYGTYYVNKIDGWKNDYEECNVELVKLS